MTSARRVLLQAGFGLGHAFLQAWAEWRQDTGRAPRLDFVALASQPPAADALRQAHRGTPLAPLAALLADRWPPMTRNLHRIGLDAGRVQLLLAPGEALDWLPELQARVDAFLIDELDCSADPERAPTRVAKALARLAAPGATLRATQAPPALRPALASAGFELEVGSAGGALRGTYRPRFVPRSRQAAPTGDGERHACIVGAGLAGCAAARALAEQGWSCTLVDRGAVPATLASGNPAGLFHGVVHAQDGTHARLHRAAALAARQEAQDAIDAGLAAGRTDGALRLDTRGLDLAAMQAELRRQRLPPDHVQALDVEAASARAGRPLAHPAWYFPGGGWVQPAALARSYLQRAGPAARFIGGRQVHALRRVGEHWQLCDAAGEVIAYAPTVVLANAADASRLCGGALGRSQTVRGQLSLYRNADAPATHRLQLPTLPLAGSGYLLPEVDGWAVFGASSQPEDADDSVRPADQAYNLQRLAGLSEAVLPARGLDPSLLSARVAWRCQSADRLPWVGAVPDLQAIGAWRGDRLDGLPRRPGLFVFSALGSRGIAWSALGAQLLASRLSGAPLPLERSLVDALDPGRWLVRARRRSAPGP
jgi:tRNA 5-methylaminomethyl-2-thiouridine biosynthesis bifunctional protein